jgi:hypothetical protein
MCFDASELKRHTVLPFLAVANRNDNSMHTSTMFWVLDVCLDTLYFSPELDSLRPLVDAPEEQDHIVIILFEGARVHFLAEVSDGQEKNN